MENCDSVKGFFFSPTFISCANCVCYLRIIITVVRQRGTVGGRGRGERGSWLGNNLRIPKESGFELVSSCGL